MSFLSNLEAEPFAFDFFEVLRRFERGSSGKPRIGDSAACDEEIVVLGQDPYAEFPASNIARFDRDSRNRHRMLCRFLGMLGPQGPLPLHITIEARIWSDMRDESFARFLDLFNHRFLQLFYRAWANGRPVAQRDRPESDQFVTYVGATVGIGTKPFRKRDTVDDFSKLAMAGLLGPSVKSASRLENFITYLFDAKCEVEQAVGTWLKLERSDQSSVAGKHSRLGHDILLGATSYSVQDKFRICLMARDLEQFEGFLPDGAFCERLADAVYFYLGYMLDYDVEIAIPGDQVRPMQLGSFGRLGWTSWMTAGTDTEPGQMRKDCRFHPAEFVAARRSGGKKPKQI